MDIEEIIDLCMYIYMHTIHRYKNMFNYIHIDMDDRYVLYIDKYRYRSKVLSVIYTCACG